MPRFLILGKLEYFGGAAKLGGLNMDFTKWKISEIKEVWIVPTEEEQIKNNQIINTHNNKFYTADRYMALVSKEEFDDFLNHYPRHLDVDVCAISDPPAISYNDFELANRWPDSVVASTLAWDDDPKDYFYCPPEKREYRILKNYQECFDSKTGYKEGE